MKTVYQLYIYNINNHHTKYLLQNNSDITKMAQHYAVLHKDNGRVGRSALLTKLYICISTPKYVYV